MTDRVVDLAERALAALDDRRLDVWERLGLTVRQIRFMHLLQRHRDWPCVTKLAAEMGVHPAIITGLTDRLTDLGLVVRKVDARDRRVKHVELTPLGRSALAASPVEAALIRERVSRLDSGAAAALTYALDALDGGTLARA
ncbi:MAG TPA: MarR family transcriptional regulator [Dehalococcoidia bacterium]|nr:MarR family transcriptional regulator [Dehalococcoidia bacterium]